MSCSFRKRRVSSCVYCAVLDALQRNRRRHVVGREYAAEQHRRVLNFTPVCARCAESQVAGMHRAAKSKEIDVDRHDHFLGTWVCVCHESLHGLAVIFGACSGPCDPLSASALRRSLPPVARLRFSFMYLSAIGGPAAIDLARPACARHQLVVRNAFVEDAERQPFRAPTRRLVYTALRARDADQLRQQPAAAVVAERPMPANVVVSFGRDAQVGGAIDMPALAAAPGSAATSVWPGQTAAASASPGRSAVCAPRSSIGLVRRPGAAPPHPGHVAAGQSLSAPVITTAHRRIGFPWAASQPPPASVRSTVRCACPAGSA